MIRSHLLAAVLEADAGERLNPTYLPAIAAAVGLVGELLAAAGSDRTDGPMSDYTAGKIGTALTAAITQAEAVLPAVAVTDRAG